MMAAKKIRLTPQERGRVRRVTTMLNTVEKREFASESEPGRVYTTIVLRDGRLQCNCRGWTVRKTGQVRQCKHARVVIGLRKTRDDGEYQYILFPEATT